MDDAQVLVLEADIDAGARIRNALKRWHYAAVACRSVSDAVTRPNWPRIEAVIADFNALAGQAERAAARESELRAAIERMRSAQEAAGASEEGWRPLIVIVTSDKEDLAKHAAAISAGADLYLSEAAAKHDNIMRAYLERMLRPRASDSEAVEPKAAADLAEVFDLPTQRLRSESGRLDAARIAAALGVPLKRLADAMTVQYTTVHKTPDSPALQADLASFANVIAMLDQVYEGDVSRVLAWLQSTQPELGGQTPQAALLESGGAKGVEQFVSGAWLGEPD